ncbi:aspartate aminotransferase [Burkholderia sp. Nafp2/4-1b]|uniref:pyridoxal phosphate-dependent aminotransferase n=1 Tax=Burkholderia sp. Nafp2/4-1b TaxID=2116686 RepID=UPI000EF86302|nr:pyridoxal phosphate-dependent aminotransferase [Burkholderia sp. Nafp2/4-1b]RKT98717.1 aspartate aminotransferase [Burkholderia sp. Nafp2/4-1b]
MISFNYTSSKRLGLLSLSPFHVVLHAANEEANRGRDVIYLSVGEPGYVTPENVKEAAIRAIRDNKTRYTATEGTVELRTAIRDKLIRDNDLTYALDEITVTMGGVQAIFNLLMATVEDGDEIVLPAPFFSPYLSSIQLSGAKPILLQTQNAHGFVPRASEIEELLTPRSRWLVLNSPSNPSGAVIDEDELRRIAAVVERHPRLMVLSDDMYEALRFDSGPFRNILNVAPGLANRTVVLNGVSKTYSMTGWRLAYLAGPKPIIAAVTQVSLSTAFAPNSISQVAATEALVGPQTEIAMQVEEYKARRDALVEALKVIPDLPFAIPRGTFFLFANCEAYLGLKDASGRLVETDLDLVLHVLRETGVALMPGSGFGTPGHIRISFAAPEKRLKEAVGRLAHVLAELKQAPARSCAAV